MGMDAPLYGLGAEQKTLKRIREAGRVKGMRLYERDTNLTVYFHGGEEQSQSEEDFESHPDTETNCSEMRRVQYREWKSGVEDGHMAAAEKSAREKEQITEF